MAAESEVDSMPAKFAGVPLAPLIAGLVLPTSDAMHFTADRFVNTTLGNTIEVFNTV